MKRLGRNDIIFMAVILAVIACAAGWLLLTRGENGACVLVTVDGEAYGTYLLSEEQDIPIQINGETANFLVIRDGKADMTEADCPDRLCVRQKAISRTNETIVCLPNKVVVQVMGSKESGFDSIAK